MSSNTIMPGAELDLDNPNEAQEQDGPVECLGKTFANDQERREYYLKILAEKLKDPEFRKIEGFPIGEDEDILNLSDPPYYTACPNPFIEEFINFYGKPYDPSEIYKREPYATDVSEGKNDPIYNAHGYHTKVPHKAIMRYILHYTDPDDVVFDGFCGTGMTGVAAQLCGDRVIVESLGYKVLPNGDILQELKNETTGECEWSKFSKLGKRRAILNDLSPIATFIAHNYNAKLNLLLFFDAATTLLKKLKEKYGWMYETSHLDGTKCQIDYVVWSEIFSCPHCGDEFDFVSQAFDEETKTVKDEFPCASCNTTLTKRKVERVFDNIYDVAKKENFSRVKFKPVRIHYKLGKQKFNKAPDQNDMTVLEKISELDWPSSAPTNRFPIEHMYHGSRFAPKGLTNAHHFYFRRPLESLCYLWGAVNNESDDRLRHALLFFVEQAITSMNMQNRYGPKKYSQSNGALPLVYYIPSQISEVSPWYVLEGKLKRLKGVFASLNPSNDDVFISTASTASVDAAENSLDYIFTDPPFGENIFYADLNLITESWHRVFTNSETEAVVDKFKKKYVTEYHHLLLTCFRKYYRALKPGRWITVEFSNSSAGIWNVIQATLQDAGFVVANVSALDKLQGSFRAVTTTTAVKQDLVISAYKPNGGFENRFVKESDEEGVWDFVRTHLGYLPVVKKEDSELLKVPERDPRILFDQVVAYFVRNLRSVPLSSKEFQEGLLERFAERDGMIFLPEQVAQYDKARMTSSQLRQLTIFVDDEASAIEWLRQLLNAKPQTYQDIHPKFINELSGWKKAEIQLELSKLLLQNFIKFDGSGQVPPQIHSYLSTNFKELRNLSKDDPALLNKAKDRWYVPNPEREEDLQIVRERDLIKQFEEYKSHTGKKIKLVRMEAVRAGFKKAWQDRDYATIIQVAEKISANLLQEDQKLLMWYDQAQTRHSDSSLF